MAKAKGEGRLVEVDELPRRTRQSKYARVLDEFLAGRMTYARYESDGQAGRGGDGAARRGAQARRRRQGHGDRRRGLPREALRAAPATASAATRRPPREAEAAHAGMLRLQPRSEP